MIFALPLKFERSADRGRSESLPHTRDHEVARDLEFHDHPAVPRRERASRITRQSCLHGRNSSSRTVAAVARSKSLAAPQHIAHPLRAEAESMSLRTEIVNTLDQASSGVAFRRVPLP